MAAFKLSNQQIADFEKDGYVIVRGFLSAAETDKLYKIAIGDDAVKKHAFDLNDQTGKKTKLTLWYKPGNDTYGLLTRSRKMVESADRLLDGGSPVCHFHSKLMQKEPKV